MLTVGASPLLGARGGTVPLRPINGGARSRDAGGCSFATFLAVTTMERLRVYAAHLAPAHMQPVGARAPADSDPVIVSGWRTPFGKAGRGGLAETTNADLLWHCLRAVLEETRVAPQEVTDVVIGKASGDSGAALMAVRAAGFLAVSTTFFSPCSASHSSRRACRWKRVCSW